MLKDLNRNTFLRLSDNDAHLFELLDGTHSLADLIGIAEQRFGAAGRAAARAPARRPRRARLPGRRRGRRRRSAEEPQGFLQRLFKPREKTFERRRRLLRGALPPRRLGALHAPGAVRDRGADRGRARRVRLPDRRALRHAVRRRAAGRARRAHLPDRALRGGGGARDRARAGDGLVRAPDPPRRVQARGDLPVRVRRHLGGVVRAAQAPHRDQRGRARSPTSRSAGSSRSAACSCEGTTRDVFFQLAFAGYVGAFFNLNPFIDRDGYHILVDYLREPGLRQAREGPVQPPPDAARAAAPTRPCSPATRSRARLVDTGCRLRDLHVTAL